VVFGDLRFAFAGGRGFISGFVMLIPSVRALALFVFGLGSLSAATVPAELDLVALRSALIPKREVGADVFLKEHPTWDGRGVVIAVWDTGVDPAAAGMAVTTTGERKIVDILDASGSGDVVTTTKRKPDAGGQLLGLSGRKLTLPEGVKNPTGEYRLGLKPASELFYTEVLKRVNDRRAAERGAAASRRQAERAASPEAMELKAIRAKAPGDRTRTERDVAARAAALEALEDGKATVDSGALYDCVLWQDGTDWRVVIDTDEDGDLRDEKVLRPFGVAGEYGSFGDFTFATFGVQVYAGGDLLSVVTVGGAHGTHVASIAAGHSPKEPGRDGIAPGARILSIKIGDIRSGGGSYYTSELRALALSAQHKVDIVNASWGARTQYQDGKNLSGRVYDDLTERYDILAVVSAGNNGPALGTAGSAGAEASRLLGVGAYMSAEMGRVLYNTLKPSAAAAQLFTSRGPTKDGDFGVDIMAPGAAFAAISAETIRGADMYNGTSMAAPSASGVAALVLSAAKVEKLDASPARLRAALMRGSQPLPAEELVTSGSGLINAPGGLAKLRALQGVAAFGGFYDLEVNQGTFTSKGRGLLLRETITEPKRRVAVKITPAWAESVASAARFAFEGDVVLKPSVPWITAPDFVHLTNGARTVSLLVEAPPVPTGALGSVNVARVDALLAAKPELGLVFSIPVTLVQPAPAAAFKDQKLDTAVPLSPSETKRLFVEAPADATRLRITVKHRAPDTLVRTFNIQALAFAAQTHVGAMESEITAALLPGEERTFDLRLKPGSVAEIACSLAFSAVGDATLDTRLEWIGVGAGAEPVVLPTNAGWGALELNPLADRDVKVEAKLDRAVHVFLPESTTQLALDARSELPASPLTPGPERSPLLRQRFTLDLKEPMAAHVLAGDANDLTDEIGGGRITLVHESGEVIYDSTASNSTAATRTPTRLPKGKITATRDYTALNAESLAGVTLAPLRLSEPLKTARALGVRASLRDRLSGKDVTELKLKGGREEMLFLQDKATDDLAKHEPKPAYFAGDVTFKDNENREIARQPVLYLPGASPAKTTNVEPKTKPVKDDRSEIEKLADTLYDGRLAFVREQRGTKDEAVRARRAEVLTALRAERPADAAPVFEQALEAALAAGLAGDSWPKAKPTPAAGGDKAKAGATTGAKAEDDEKTKSDEDAEAKPAATPAAGEKAKPAGPALDAVPAVLALLDEAAKLAGPEAVAQYFGAPPAAVPGDLAARPALEREKKRFMAQREILARTERLRADVHRAAGSWDAAWKALAEVKRWEPETGDKQTRAIEAAALEQAKLFGLALEALNARLKDDPSDKKLRTERAALYDKLGWSEYAAWERQRLARFAHQRKVADGW
jgi:tripeptidyl-peptidase-2